MFQCSHKIKIQRTPTQICLKTEINSSTISFIVETEDKKTVRTTVGTL